MDERNLSYRILGPFSVLRSSGEEVRLPPMQQMLLARLIVADNNVVSTDALIDSLWGSQPPSGGKRTLAYHVSKLREALHPDESVVTESSGYRLEVTEEQVDARWFEALAREGGLSVDSNPIVAARVLRKALALWHGEALIDFAYEDFARLESERLATLRVDAVEHRISADIEVGEHSAVVSELQGLVHDHPYREGLWKLLMLSLYRSDRQAEALRAARDARDALAEIGVEPSVGLVELEEQILQQDPKLDPAPASRQTKYVLPADRSAFVGRATELATIDRFIGSSRLVTLTGMGGIGKTRLALAAARGLRSRFDNGAALVALEDVTSPVSRTQSANQPMDGSATDDEAELLRVADTVASEIGLALGIKEKRRGSRLEQICESLKSNEMLLLLDNCEHLIDGVALAVSKILDAAPGVSIIATSRKHLDVSSEQLLEVAPLATPPEASIEVDVAREYDALRFFESRARMVSPDFTVTRGSLGPVLEICRTLEGLPLAIELTVKLLKARSVEQIRDELNQHGLAALERGSRDFPSRHQTMGAVIGWSYGMLATDQQRALLERLSIFRGSFDYRAVLSICADDVVSSREVLDMMADLVEASLVISQGTEAVRYRLHGLIRQFGLDSLEQKGQLAQLHEKHAVYFVDRAEQEQQMQSYVFR